MRKITKKENSLLLQTLDFIGAYNSYFDNNNIGIHGDFTNPKAPKIDYLSFNFPSEDEFYYIDFKQFIEIAPEILTIEVVEKRIIKTANTRYYVVSPNDNYHEYILRNYYNLKTISKLGAELDLVVDSLIVGLVATGLGEHDEDFWGTYSPYFAIKITYLAPTNVLLPEQELNLVRSYIFEIAETTGIALQFSEIGVPFFDYEDYEDETENEEYIESNSKDIKYLESYNEGMKLYVSAVQIQDAELKFLNFYKILEHFAPVVVNIERYELMREKLTIPSSTFEEGDYIKSIFDLVKSVRSRFNDEDLIKSTINVCFNLVDHFEDLPQSIKFRVCQAIGVTELNSSVDPNKLKIAGNMVGKIVYNTRNKVVHAKSNFRPTENVCDSSELEQLNIFMREVCSKTIRWYNKQPQHLKLTIIG